MLILSINARMIHLLDRIRQLVDGYEVTGNTYMEEEIALLFKRARLVRVTIYSLVFSIFCDVLVILTTFISKTTSLDLGSVIMTCFGVGILALILGLVVYLFDVNKNLNAVRIEILHRVHKKNLLGDESMHPPAPDADQPLPDLAIPRIASPSE